MLRLKSLNWAILVRAAVRYRSEVQFRSREGVTATERPKKNSSCTSNLPQGPFTMFARTAWHNNSTQRTKCDFPLQMETLGSREGDWLVQGHLANQK